jgi:hypothetical protein
LTACRALRLQLRGALAAIPLSPAALGAKLLLNHTQTAPTTTTPPAAPSGTNPWHATLAQPKLAAIAAAATLAIGAAGTTASHGDANRASRADQIPHAAPSPAESHTFLNGESLGEHLTHNPLTHR